jgi:hypothetical protein
MQRRRREKVVGDRETSVEGGRDDFSPGEQFQV